MAVHPIPSFAGKPTAVAAARDRIAPREVGEAGSPARDDVRVSARAQVLARVASDVDATPDSLRRRAAELAAALGKELRDGGVDAGRPLAFDVDTFGGTVRVRDDRPDAGAIDAVLARRPELVAQIRDVAVLQRHADALDSTSGAAAAQRATADAVEASGLVARFAPPGAASESVPGLAVVDAGGTAVWSRQLRAAAAYSTVAGEIDVARLAALPPRQATRGRGSGGRDDAAD